MLPEPILSPSLIIAPVQWDIMEEIQHPLANEPPPPGYSASKQYVPVELHPQFIHWVHSALSLAHLDIQTTKLVQNSFWWPSMTTDIKTYVPSVCPGVDLTWTNSSTVTQVEPFLIAWCPWSHIAVDFVTTSQIFFNTILVAVDDFQKPAKCHLWRGSPQLWKHPGH